MAVNTGKIAALVRKLDTVATTSWRNELIREVAGEALQLVDAGFRKTQTPYGSAWRPRKGGGAWPLLQKTGALIGSFTSVPIANGFRIISSAPYAGFHQYGTRNMQSRGLLPMQSRGLPTNWSAMIQKVWLRRVREAMR